MEKIDAACICCFSEKNSQINLFALVDVAGAIVMMVWHGKFVPSGDPRRRSASGGTGGEGWKASFMVFH